jgi:hypothetical protein
MHGKNRVSLLRRAALRKLAVSSALGAGGFAALIREALAASPQQGIRQMKGTVTIDGKPAAPGQAIRPGQKVATGEDGEAVFVVGKDAFLQRRNSEFVIERSAGARIAIPVLRYITGSVLSVFGKGKKTLSTPTATIGIRGTACYIESAPEQVYFCLCYGTAIVTPAGDPAQRTTIRTMHHDHPITIGAAAGSTMMANALVINHTDAELTMLEALVGRKPAFYGKKYKDDY